MQENKVQGMGIERTPHVRGNLLVAQTRERANALVGAALHIQFRAQALLLTRIVWFVLIVLSLLVYWLTTPARYNQLLNLGAENTGYLQDLGLPSDFFADYIGTLDLLTVAVYTAIAGLIFARKSKEWIGLFASLMLVTTAVTEVRPGDALVWVDPILQLPVLLVFTLGTASILGFLYIFPDGHFSPRWTRWLVLVLVLFAVYYYLIPALVINPLPWPPPPISPLLVAGIAAGAIVQIYRYARVSSPLQKQQTRWVVYGLVVGAAGLVVFLQVIPSFFPQVKDAGLPRVVYILVGVPLFYLSLILLPLSIGVSILRYRLWNIDLLINRTLVYVPLTGILAGLFAAVITLSQKLFVSLTGQESDIATVLTTLVVVAAFTPLKDRLQALVDKRFKDSADAAKKLKVFADQVQARVSPLSPAQITRRLLDEAVAAFDASGGAAFLAKGDELKLISSVGEWKGEACLSAPIQSSEEGRKFGVISLSARKNGEDYDDPDCETLSQTVQVVARALEEDIRASPGTG